MKEALRSRECCTDWAAHLPWVLMGLRAAPKEDCGISSAELVNGQELHLPGQPTLSTAPVAEGAATPPTVRPALPTRLTGDLNQTGRVPDQPEGATHVYVLNGSKPSLLSPPYSGPYLVRLRGLKSFNIFIGGRLETISVDRLKLHRGRAVPVPAPPPVRGRPKRV
jgi:hypothetical protein